MIEQQARKIVDEYVAKYRPLDLEMRRTWYEYDTTGNRDASNRLAKIELDIRQLNSDPIRFAELKSLYKDKGKVEDVKLRRELEVVFLRHLPNQVSADRLKELTKLERVLQETFNDYRPSVDGKKLTPVEADHILSDSTDNSLLEKVWKAQKMVAPLLEDNFRNLVKLRNNIATDLGFDGSVELAAAVGELDTKLLGSFYNDVHKATEKPFKRLKEQYIDPRLAKRYGVSVDEMKPWHYQNGFFQEAPNAIFGDVDLDKLYAGVDSNYVIKQTVDFYGSLGVDIKRIVENSSLFPKPGKNPHAVAWYLDPDDSDSPVLIMNLPESGAPKASDVSTLVHELAHDINYKSVLSNTSVPYLLSEPTMLTEAVAMLFEHQTLTTEWFRRLGVDEGVAAEASKRVELINYVDQIIFLRWASTIYEFETSFYSDPSQDIGDLWWECKRKHQFLNRPEGWKNSDALAKYHIPNVSLLYYSNYAIGRVANVQFADLLAKQSGQGVQGASYFNHKELGEWLMNDFLAQGELCPWYEFLERSTGKSLSVKSWKKYYIDSDLEARLICD